MAQNTITDLQHRSIVWYFTFSSFLRNTVVWADFQSKGTFPIFTAPQTNILNIQLLHVKFHIILLGANYQVLVILMAWIIRRPNYSSQIKSLRPTTLLFYICVTSVGLQILPANHTAAWATGLRLSWMHGGKLNSDFQLSWAELHFQCALKCPQTNANRCQRAADFLQGSQ